MKHDACPRSALAIAAVAAAFLLSMTAPAGAQQVTVFFDDFDENRDGNWATEQNVTVEDPGGVLGSNAFYFNGENKEVKGSAELAERWAATGAIDLSLGGAQVFFFLRYEGEATSTGDVAEFEEMDKEDSDDLLLEYSTNGVTWTTFRTFLHESDAYRDGAQVIETLPSEAWVSAVKIRIWMSGESNRIDNDQFAIDDFQVVVNPEPETWALFGLGTAGFAAFVRRRRARLTAARAASVQATGTVTRPA